MANWSNTRMTVGQAVATFISDLLARLIDCATLGKTSASLTNPKDGHIRLIRKTTNTKAKLEEYNATTQVWSDTELGGTTDASELDAGTLHVDRLPKVPINKGGTGATSAADARTNLGTHNANNLTAGKVNNSRLNTIPLNKGGTGGTTASQARTNIGANNASNLNTGTLPDARLPNIPVGKLPGMASKVGGIAVPANPSADKEFALKQTSGGVWSLNELPFRVIDISHTFAADAPATHFLYRRSVAFPVWIYQFPTNLMEADKFTPMYLMRMTHREDTPLQYYRSGVSHEGNNALITLGIDISLTASTAVNKATAANNFDWLHWNGYPNPGSRSQRGWFERAGDTVKYPTPGKTMTFIMHHRDDGVIGMKTYRDIRTGNINSPERWYPWDGTYQYDQITDTGEDLVREPDWPISNWPDSSSGYYRNSYDTRGGYDIIVNPFYATSYVRDHLPQKGADWNAMYLCINPGYTINVGNPAQLNSLADHSLSNYTLRNAFQVGIKIFIPQFEYGKNPFGRYP